MADETEAAIDTSPALADGAAEIAALPCVKLKRSMHFVDTSTRLAPGHYFVGETITEDQADYVLAKRFAVLEDDEGLINAAAETVATRMARRSGTSDSDRTATRRESGRSSPDEGAGAPGQLEPAAEGSPPAEAANAPGEAAPPADQPEGSGSETPPVDPARDDKVDADGVPVLANNSPAEMTAYLETLDKAGLQAYWDRHTDEQLSAYLVEHFGVEPNANRHRGTIENMLEGRLNLKDD